MAWRELRNVCALTLAVREGEERVVAVVCAPATLTDTAKGQVACCLSVIVG